MKFILTGLEKIILSVACLAVIVLWMLTWPMHRGDL